MNASDFEYDGHLLSQYGFVICSFDESKGVQIDDAGSKISFTKVPNYSGRNNILINTKYDECIQITFDVCKDPEIYSNEEMVVTDEELLKLIRWLNRREFKKLRFDYDDSRLYYLNASFNFSKITIADKTYGLRLTIETDKPFGYRDVEDQVLEFSANDVTNRNTMTFVDLSDEIGSVYPDITIVCKGSGDITLNNDLTGCNTTILGCTANEVITIRGDEQIISTSLSSHDIYNSFNWEFFSIGNVLNNRLNNITSTLPATVIISYQPVVKLI